MSPASEEVLGVKCALPPNFQPRAPRAKIRWTREEREEIRHAAWQRLYRLLMGATLILITWHLARGMFTGAILQTTPVSVCASCQGQEVEAAVRRDVQPEVRALPVLMGRYPFASGSDFCAASAHSPQRLTD